MKFVTYMKHNKKKHRLLSGYLNGTVFSGHPTRTTFGNSLRVYLYTDYVMHLSNITKRKIWVCGDDMLCIINKNDLPEFHDHFWDVYTN